MRNLKRALSLAMASVMLLGMMVVGTGAASYTDVTSKNNQEAIEVLKAVGVMTGDEKGDFNPDKKVTRNEMAVIMANLLKLTVNDFGAVTTPFKDVPTWAAPYVAACYADGIIAGTSKTTFGGNDSVTAVQGGLMILKALGYFQYTDDFGDDWQLATVKQASKIDLYDGIDAGRTDALTRNEVAQMVLNALQSDMVDFTGDLGSDITTSDGTVIKIGYRSEYSTLSTTYNYNNAIVGTHDRETRQLVEELFKDDMKKTGTTDSFGRPANKWDYKYQNVGTYAKAPIATYTNKVTKGTMYSLIGKGTIDGLTSKNAALSGDTNTIVLVVDGAYQTFTKSDVFTSGSSASIANSTPTSVTGNGAQTQVYKDDDGNVTIAVVNTYLVQARGDYNATREGLTIDPVSNITLNDNTLFAKDFAVENYEDEDYILVNAYLSSGKYIVKSVAPAEKLEGKVTSYTEKDNVTVDGTTYKYAFTVDADSKNTAYSVGDNAILILDSNGYVMFVDDATVDSGKYVYMDELAKGNGVGNHFVADAYFSDGTNSVITVKKVNNTTVTTGNVGSYNVKGWYTYTSNGDNEYELKTANVTKNTFTQGTTIPTSNFDAVKKGVVKFGDGLSANAKTIFVVKDLDGNVTSYTGIANAPTITVKSTSTQDIYYVLNDGNSYVRFAYIDASDSTKVGSIDDSKSSDELMFVIHRGSVAIDSDDNRYRNWKVLVDGVVQDLKTVESPANIAEGALVKNIRTNKDGYVTGATVVTAGSEWAAVAAMPTTSNPVHYKDGVLTIGTTPYVVADKAEIYLIADKTASLLLNDENSDFEMTSKNADGLYKALRGYVFNGSNTTYQAKTDSNTGELLALYVYVGAAVTEDMTVTFSATTTDAGITAFSSVAVAQASGNVTVAGNGTATSASNTITITANAPYGASASGSIVLSTTDGSTWTASGSITIVGVEGTAVIYPSTGTISVTITP